MGLDLLFAALTILTTAVLSSVCTLALAGWIFERRIRPELEAQIDQRVDEAVEILAAEVETRVRRGVAEGLVEGVSNLPRADVVRDATRTAARSGVDLLSAILGGRRAPDPDRP